MILEDKDDELVLISRDDDDESDDNKDIDLSENDDDTVMNVITLPEDVRCTAHTLNLLATSDFVKGLKLFSLLKKHKSVLKECNFLWKAIRRPKSAESILVILGGRLIYPVITRWNSLYGSINRVLKYKDKLNFLLEHICSESNNPTLAFTEPDFIYPRELQEVLLPIAIALDTLQKDKIYFGDLLPSV